MASFLYDPAWRQAVKRFVNWPTCFISWAVERSLHSERFGLGRAVRRSYGRMRRNAANVRSTLIQSRAKALSAGRATFRHSTRWAEHLDGRYPGLRRLLPLAAKRFLRRLAGPHRQPSARRYIPADLDIAGFFAELRRRQVRYVVLRWFESLPDLDPGEDIDLLVDDEDAVQLLDFLNANAGPVACDVYTVSGLPGTRYKQMPYYPPALAKQIVSRSVSDGLCRMPCAEDHFLSLAYHAVYHKGLRSGLPTTVASLKPVAQPEHDYRSALTELATTLGLEVAIDMESLDQALAEHGWRPPVDTLKQLAIHNEWVRLSFFGQPAPRNALRPQVREEVSASSGMTLK
jgi:hypothetical protein